MVNLPFTASCPSSTCVLRCDKSSQAISAAPGKCGLQCIPGNRGPEGAVAQPHHRVLQDVSVSESQSLAFLLDSGTEEFLEAGGHTVEYPALGLALLK